MNEEAEDEVISVYSADQEMMVAIEAARSSFGDFLEVFKNPKANQDAFLVKVRFAKDDDAEHIWMADLELSSEPYAGTMANEPKMLGLRYLDRYTFSRDQISDWMYVEDNDIVGAFTSKLLIKRQPPKQGLMGWARSLFGWGAN